jgi:hypothetical protein
MCDSTNNQDKDKESDRVDTHYTSSDQSVTPIYNGKVQPECTFEEFVEDLGNNHPTNWSHIKNDN